MAQYLDYTWKDKDNTKTYVERAVKQAIYDVVDSGYHPTNKRVNKQVIVNEGPYFAQKNKPTSELMMETKELFVPRRSVPFVVNDKENFIAAFRTFNVFKRNVDITCN